MTNHIPGPWHTKITADGELWLVISNNFEIYLGDLEEIDEERHAIARLMASAPELLAACQGAFKAIKMTPLWPRRTSDKWIDYLENAITKATGQNMEATSG